MNGRWVFEIIGITADMFKFDTLEALIMKVAKVAETLKANRSVVVKSTVEKRQRKMNENLDRNEQIEAYSIFK